MDDTGYGLISQAEDADCCYASFIYDIECAKKLIEIASKSGCDAIKFQTFRPETLYVKNAGFSDYLSKQGMKSEINEIFTNDSDDMENVIDDLTPQLGGNLDLNSKIINGTGSIAGTVTGITQSPGNNSTKLATTAYVDAQVATEDTLAEMNDTTMSGLADLNILQYDSGTSTWKNQTMSAAGIPSSGFAVAMAIALG